MKLTHNKGKIVHFHHNSGFAQAEMGTKGPKNYIFLQVEELKNKDYTYLAEIVKKEDFKGIEDLGGVR